jgi:hypothetical protein
MPGRVFISCGQAAADERRVAGEVRQWFRQKGFEPYVAIETQSLEDVNSGIIGQLMRADFYVFIDFCREKLLVTPNAGGSAEEHRGSLFTNQELAVAMLLEFNDRAIFLQQEGVRLEGLMRYMASNARRFEAVDEVPDLVSKMVEDLGWQPSYTRHLMVGAEHWTPDVLFGDHTGRMLARVFELDIHNRRNDLGALNAILRLRTIAGADGEVCDVDRSPLKVVGQQGFTHTIWPESHAAWDLLAVRLDQPAAIYLNSALDVAPRKPIISAPGEYLLTYEMFAEKFPTLSFNVRLSVSRDPRATTAMVEREQQSYEDAAK